ncbi:MAG: M28 family peptidase, partial [Bacteroidales bacterium]
IMAVMFAALTASSVAQFVPHYQWTLLDKKLMDLMIGEASGETALAHDIEMGGYTRDRLTREYQTVLWESQYIMDKLKEYGITDSRLERFGDMKPTWDGISGELWEVSPGLKKLADYKDQVAMLVQGSQNADIEAELVWIGDARKSDYDSTALAGKIVVTYASPGQVQSLITKYGAVGVLSFNSPRPLADPVQMPYSSMGGRGGAAKGFGFQMPPREGYFLRDRLVRGEKIRVHAKVKSTTENVDLQVPTCVLPGTDPAAGEIIFSAHIFEGVVKQGANDDLSGGACLLEMARMLNTLYNDGRLPRPARSVRFIWVPEFSGTGPWVNAHKDIMEKTLCNINLDMVGILLSQSQSFFNLERTTFGNPHYINDVMENYFRYVGETNRTSLVLSGREGYLNRIVAPSGSDEPFYYAIEGHYGASDHEVFNDWAVGVPAVMMITWPDLYYHTSQDLSDKLDPTQLKRCCVIGAASAYTIASADAGMAGKIAGEVFSNSIRRLGMQQGRSIDELSKLKAENLVSGYKRIRGYIEGALLNETETVETTLELAPKDANLIATVALQTAQLKKLAEGQLLVLDQEMKQLSAKLGTPAIVLKPDELEKKAATVIPVTTPKVKEAGYGEYRKFMPQMTREQMTATYRDIANTSELERLCNGKHNAIQIKQMLDTQYAKETSLKAVLDYVEILKTAGLIVLAGAR